MSTLIPDYAGNRFLLERHNEDHALGQFRYTVRSEGGVNIGTVRAPNDAEAVKDARKVSRSYYAEIDTHV